MSNHLTLAIRRLNLYPVSIHQTRYGGVYEGSDALWFAVSGDVPEDAVGDDGECLDFWLSDASLLVGRGKTPNEALINLIQRVKSEDARLFPHFGFRESDIFSDSESGLQSGNDD